MKLSSLIGAEDKIIGPDAEIFGLCHNSKMVKKGDVFFALSGQNFSGVDYIKEAIENGACAIITDKNIGNIDGASVVQTQNARSAMAQMASRFYSEPQNKMVIVMITGTNGKTTTTYIIKSILNSAGIKAGIIGTTGAIWGNNNINTGMTTPDPIELFNILSQMQKDNVKVVIMEASAHALALNKLDGIKSDISVLTNITEDHLDFFKTMDNYAMAKYKLFSKEKSRAAVVCTDDSYTKNMFYSLKIPSISCGLNKNADIKAEKIANNSIGQTFSAIILGKKQDYNIALDGVFNVKNALCAIAAAKLLGISEENIKDGLKHLEAVPGRFNRINANGAKVIIDFAHTPDGILNVIQAGRKLAEANRLIVVFGCGGDRDKQKRSIMGKIATNNADFCYITSDNPRSEKPADIIAEITSGISKNNYCVIEDRKEAIKAAIVNANANDVVMILGKGHENYMEINGVKHPYSDYSVVEEIVESNKEK